MPPDPKAQRHFTDPDSKSRQASNKGWDQCGNAQALVDESQLLLAAEVTPQANEVRQVAPLLDRMEAHFAAAEITQRPKDFVADVTDKSRLDNVSSHGRLVRARMSWAISDARTRRPCDGGFCRSRQL